jgi:2'-5' RNA ligase
MLSPLIVTAKMDASSFEFFDGLRRRHFPPERNFLSAHITMFHHLPGAEIIVVEDGLRSAALRQMPIELEFSNVRFLGRGTAIEIESAELNSLRGKLANERRSWLTAQDNQKFKPHITVQNKVAPEEAKILFEQLKSAWEIKMGKAVGLQLWHYRNGPWELAKEFVFGDSEKQNN